MSVRKMVLVFFMSVSICCAKDIQESIRTNPTSMNLETWHINVDQCFNYNPQACKMLLDDGIKDSNQCNPKKECSLIGKIYWNANNFTESLEFFKKSCNAKDMVGCYYIGLNYEKLQDYQNAKDMYEKACARVRSPEACNALGLMYDKGYGVRQDYLQAQSLYIKSCKKKYANACYHLAILYEDGKGEIHNVSLAKEFYGKACDYGLQKGCDEYRKLNQAGVPLP